MPISSISYVRYSNWICSRGLTGYFFLVAFLVYMNGHTISFMIILLQRAMLCGIHPRMVPYLLQNKPLPWTNPETCLYEVLALAGHLGYEEQLPTADGLVTIKRNVAAHKIIQQDSKGPSSQLFSVIFSIHYPLWRGVYSGACNNCLVMYTYFD